MDPARPLSPKGRDEVARLAERVRGRDLAPTRILHSTKRRAQETATLLAEALDLATSPEEADGLLPDDPVDPWLARLETDEGLLLVGHNPFMGILASHLAGGEGVGFGTATLAAFRKEEEGFLLDWVVSP